jgi:hypothetical protein
LSSVEDCQDPSLILGGLNMWVLGRAFPDSTDWWDQELLEIRAVCRASGAVVTATGAILRASDISHLLAGLESMHRWETNNVEMAPLEPNLAVRVARGARGEITIEVRITPDHVAQSHLFSFDADLTYLAEPIGQCREILRSFPVVKGRSFLVTPGAATDDEAITAAVLAKDRRSRRSKRTS